MPHALRLDAPGVLYHVMARGIEQHSLFRDNHDRDTTFCDGYQRWPPPVLWPRKDSEIAEFFRWLTHTLGLTSWNWLIS